MYKLLEATPKDGKEFAKAVREVLRRETSWVDWKKGKNLGEHCSWPTAVSVLPEHDRDVRHCLLALACPIQRSP